MDCCHAQEYKPMPFSHSSWAISAQKKRSLFSPCCSLLRFTRTKQRWENTVSQCGDKQKAGLIKILWVTTASLVRAVHLQHDTWILKQLCHVSLMHNESQSGLFYTFMDVSLRCSQPLQTDISYNTCGQICRLRKADSTYATEMQHWSNTGWLKVSLHQLDPGGADNNGIQNKRKRNTKNDKWHRSMCEEIR